MVIKMKKLFLLLLIMFLILLNSCSNDDNYTRLRIIANSNSEEDLTNKQLIKTIIEQYYESNKLNMNDLTEYSIKSYLLSKVKDNTISKDLYDDICIATNYSSYPSKSYKNKFIPSGYYKTILITIGNGNGNNFWTILYPEYFGFEFEENNEIEYRSYILDKIRKKE